MTMLERVAKALHETWSEDYCSWQERFRGQAITATKAMREYTDEVEQAGLRAIGEAQDEGYSDMSTLLARAWDAIIDAILEEGR